MRIGLLGGSFNPPHRGHLALALEVLAQGLADAVTLIPAADPPHKEIAGDVAAQTRLRMAELLAGEDERLSVNGLELRRTGPSYTIDTMRELLAEQGGQAYRLIIGSDMAKTFGSWRSYREILRLAPPLVAERPDCAFAGAGDYPGLLPQEVAILEAGRFHMDPVDVSSTIIRARIAAGDGDGVLRRYLTEPVLDFVRLHALYARKAGKPPSAFRA